MALEIERKFLLAHDGWRAHVERTEQLLQGYLGGTQASVRVRVAGNSAWLNIKGRTLGATRLEFEYPIPPADAEIMLRELADGPILSKQRHYLQLADHLFEIDEFTGDNAGLIVAEVELESEDEEFPRPDWLGAEVTADARYYNVNLVRQPYTQWEDQ